MKISIITSRFVLGCLCLVLSCTLGKGQDTTSHIWPVKLQKDYSKTYSLGSETVHLQNRFGKLVIETWNKEEIHVEAHIVVKATTHEYANQLLNGILILDNQKQDSISFITHFDNWNNSSTEYSGGHEIQIDYLVHIPAKAKLIAENSFGPLTIGDYSSQCELIEKYGTLTAGKLDNCPLLSVSFGKLMATSIQNSKLEFRYSQVDIGKLSGAIQAKFDFCNSIDMPIDYSVTRLDLQNSYTSLYLVFPKDFTGDYDISTYNARLSSNSLPIKEEENLTASMKSNAFQISHHYTGNFGKPGGSQIHINSRFGNIRLL